MNVHKEIRNYLLPPPPLKRNVRTIKKIFVKIGSMLAEILLHLSYKKVSFGVKRKYTASLYYSILSNYQFYKRIERKNEKTKKEKY